MMNIIEDYDVYDAENYTRSVLNGPFNEVTLKYEFEIIHKPARWLRNDTD
jgi:hypothetical protein